MLKYALLSLSSVLVTPIISNAAFNATVLENQTISDVNQYQIYEGSEYKSFGQESIDKSVEYRLYVDSSGDQLTPADRKVDYNLGYQAKNKWYDLELPIAIYKFDDFDVDNKTDLITKIGSKFTTEYYYAFNMWDSKLGWKYIHEGKDVELTKATSTVQLKTEAHTDEVQFEKAGSGTEAGRIQIRQQWGTQELKIFVRMSVWYTWKWGSIYDHASLTKFSLTDVNNGGSSQIKFDSKSQIESKNQSLASGTYKISLDSLFDNARDIYDEKEKNDWKLVLPLFTAYTIAGPMECSRGWGYGIINLFSYEPLLIDLAEIMISGKDKSGELKLTNTNTGGITTSSLYYKDLDGNSNFISQTQISNLVGCTTILFTGVSVLSYMYLTE